MPELGQELELPDVHYEGQQLDREEGSGLLSLRCSRNSEMATLRPRSLPTYTLRVSFYVNVDLLLEAAASNLFHLLKKLGLDREVFKTEFL
jgi:hypothetical protein